MTGCRASRVVAGVSGLLLCGLLLGTVGCGKGDTILKGTVTYEGKPIKGGSIDFESGSLKMGGAINDDGTYYIKKAQAGTFKVRFAVAGDAKLIEPQEAVKSKKIKAFATSGVTVEVKDGITNDVPINFTK